MVLFRTQYTGDTHKSFLERLAWMGQNGEQTVSGAGRTSQGPDRKLQFLKKILYVKKTEIIKKDFFTKYGLDVPPTGQLLILRITARRKLIFCLLRINASPFQRQYPKSRFWIKQVREKNT